MRTWLEKFRGERRASTLLPNRLFDDAAVSRERFEGVRKAGREGYRRARANDAYAEFMHPARAENLRPAEIYFLEGFDMGFLHEPDINGTMVFTHRGVHEKEWAALKGWREPEAVDLVGRPDRPVENGRINLVPIPFLDRVDPGADLFVSTWAPSESTGRAYEYVRDRDWFGAQVIPLAHSERWKPWDEEEFGRDLEKSRRDVTVEPFPFLPANRYLFAVRK